MRVRPGLLMNWPGKGVAGGVGCWARLAGQRRQFEQQADQQMRLGAGKAFADLQPVDVETEKRSGIVRLLGF